MKPDEGTRRSTVCRIRLAGFLLTADLFVHTDCEPQEGTSHPAPGCLCRRLKRPDCLKNPQSSPMSSQRGSANPLPKPERLSDLPKVSSQSEADLGPKSSLELLFFSSTLASFSSQGAATEVLKSGDSLGACPRPWHL